MAKWYGSKEQQEQCRTCINGGDKVHEPWEVNDGACHMAPSKPCPDYHKK